MRSLWFKLTAALVLVTMLGVGLAVLVPGVVTVRSFESFVRRSRDTERQVLAEALTIYYEEWGSWEGLYAIVRPRSGHMGQGMGPVMAPGMPEAWQFQVADRNGLVVAASRVEQIGAQLSAAQLREGVPIEVDGQEVGYLLPGSSVTLLREPEVTFLRRLRETVVPVGVAAGGVAILLGLLLTWQLTDPLRKLRAAAQGIAGGDLTQRVDIRSRDEIGELGRTFNQMAENLARAEQLRRHMVADIAHELRNPLTVMRGNLEAILDGVYEPSEENVASIHQQAIFLSRLVDDLQELALADAGQLRIEREPVDLAAVIQRAATEGRARAQREGVSIAVDVPSDLPVLNVDPQRISQVLGNLLDNAIRHSQGGGSVTVRASRKEDAVQVDVVDQGTGLSPEELSLVFERFYRGDKARARATGGAGLGLAIVKQLIEAHGGRVWAESTEGQGATFSFTLPIQDSAAS
ncbi:MAG: ATP-binding protein [Anaerolineae bacterium]|nr:ATP-binding protein [Anaerolineae bacterium]